MTEMSDPKARNVRLAFAQLLRRCADYVDGLAAEDVEAFLDGRVEIQLTVTSKGHKTKKKTPQPPPSEAAISEIIADLKVAESRSKGELILRERATSKATLRSVARLLDVASRKEDTSDDLLRRIVEATIGYRLSTAAIHGKGVKRAEDEKVKVTDQGNSGLVNDSEKSGER